MLKAYNYGVKRTGQRRKGYFRNNGEKKPKGLIFFACAAFIRKR